MKKMAVLYAILAVSAAAQCTTPYVADTANVLSAADRSIVLDAARSVSGADALILTVDSDTTLDKELRQYIERSPCWQSPSNSSTLKSTALVLMNDPAHRHSGIFYGSAWRHALDDHFVRIKADYLDPRLRDKDYTGAFVGTLHQISLRIKASEDEALHPATSTTVNQATDLSGFWKFLLWCLILSSSGFVIWLIFAAAIRNKSKLDEKKNAQQAALNARALATNKAAFVRQRLEEYKALNGQHVNEAQAAYELASETLTSLADNPKMNPEDSNYTVAMYKSIADAYANLKDQFSGVFKIILGVPVATAPEPSDSASPRFSYIPIPRQRHRSSQPAPAPASPQPHTVVVNNGGSDLATGILIGEMAEPRYESPAPSYDPPSSDDSPSSFGGGSSSYDNSSSSDSGGSSDYSSSDSGSSDSGGGSSDY